MTTYTWPTPSGVTSINNLVGAVTLVAGSNITITPSGQNLIIAATGGGGGSGFDTIGTFDTGVATTDGLNASGTTLFAQAATASFPGMVSTGTQTFAGAKTFTGAISASNLSGTNTGDITLGAFGSTSDAKGASLSGQVLTLQPADATHPGPITAADWVTFNGKQSALTIGNLTDVGTDGIVITGGTGAIIGSGTSIAQHVADSTHNGYLNSTDWSTFNGKQASGNYITALTGDATASGPGSAALTLATVNSNVGSFGSSTAIPSFTVNGKGLITAATTSVVIAPAGTLTGTTLASNVVTSSLTSVGTIATGVWNGTTIAIANGGTGQTTKAAAFDALSPLTTGGDLLYGGTSGTGTRLANGTSGQYLKSSGGTSAPTWNSFKAPTIQSFLSGTGTYTTPTSPAPLYIRVVMVGPGGGGAGTGSGGSGGNGVDGSAATTFGTTLLSAGPGLGGGFNGGAGGNGGAASLGSGPVGIAIAGGKGGGAANANATTGGNGAASFFGGAGPGGVVSTAGGSAQTNSGSGGGSGGSATGFLAGGGGGAGGYVDAIITTPSNTYTYVVGAKGTGHAAGTSGFAGGDGADGQIVIFEYYQ